VTAQHYRKKPHRSSAVGGSSDARWSFPAVAQSLVRKENFISLSSCVGCESLHRWVRGLEIDEDFVAGLENGFEKCEKLRLVGFLNIESLKG